MKSPELIGSTLLAIAVLFGSCWAGSHQATFSAAEWKAARPAERRKMADDFLQKYDTKGWTVEKLKGLLGEPTYEHDLWCYDISVKGSKPPGIASNEKALEDLELCVSFQEGTVADVGKTSTVKLNEGMTFDSAQWKVTGPSERMKMAANLLNSHILQGKTKQEVGQILGDANRKSDNIEIGYDLGLRMIDHIYLIFVVDSDRKVLDSKIEKH